MTDRHIAPHHLCMAKTNKQQAVVVDADQPDFFDAIDKLIASMFGPKRPNRYGSVKVHL